MDVEQLHRYVVVPVLEHLDRADPGIDSIAAQELVLGTALTESVTHFIRQKGGGPALGLWQMEPATHDDIWEHWLRNRKALRDAILALVSPWPLGAQQLCGNLYYGAAMCRIHYRRSRHSLPAPHDPLGLARMWKRVYNTSLGKGTVEKALPHFTRAVEVVAKENMR